MPTKKLKPPAPRPWVPNTMENVDRLLTALTEAVAEAGITSKLATLPAGDSPLHRAFRARVCGPAGETVPGGESAHIADFDEAKRRYVIHIVGACESPLGVLTRQAAALIEARQAAGKHWNLFVTARLRPFGSEVPDDLAFVIRYDATRKTLAVGSDENDLDTRSRPLAWAIASVFYTGAVQGSDPFLRETLRKLGLFSPICWGAE